ncbi:hypothetical protein SAMN04515679_3420 [Pelosinus fermentans]|uniref:Uncharacterized protein n=1 Tax=Pelosinus fermentans B4 TaxID=1149862 RepID=I8RKI5_9FIRM|nr:hypothetical protein FB4_0430 [Pelosinus fermentans B4]EIW21884.1 hypothetical protein FA11_0691 [Pelosinus fermentans A11]OAM95265.1 hypothetical protein FR7_03286 [Pelosinus fermentans DSM 17108]SDR25593.1 hypothetical protein SAMN04515679_3420 [Pelosinus fermentans]
MTLSLAKCQAMLPLDMAKASEIVQDSYHYLLESAGNVEKTCLRERVLDVLHNPAPSFLSILDEKDKIDMKAQHLFVGSFWYKDLIFIFCQDQYRCCFLKTACHIFA